MRIFTIFLILISSNLYSQNLDSLSDIVKKEMRYIDYYFEPIIIRGNPYKIDISPYIYNILKKQGVCVEYSIVFSDILDKNNIKNDFIIYNKDTTTSHIINRVFVDDSFVLIDILYDKAYYDKKEFVCVAKKDMRSKSLIISEFDDENGIRYIFDLKTHKYKKK